MMRILLTLLFLMPAIATADLYYGIGTAWYTPDLNATEIAGLQSADDGTRITLHLYVGHTFADGTWAIEGGYEDMDSYSWRSLVGIDNKTTAVESEVVSVAVTKHFGSFYGMLGLYRWSADTNISSSVSGNSSPSLSGSNTMYGLGWDVPTPLNWLDVRLSYTKYTGFGNANELGFKHDIGLMRVDFKVF